MPGKQRKAANQPGPRSAKPPLAGTWGALVLGRIQALGLKQVQVAQFAEARNRSLTQQTISKVIHNEIIPRERTRVLLTEILATTVPELFPWGAYEATQREVTRQREARAKARRAAA